MVAVADPAITAGGARDFHHARDAFAQHRIRNESQRKTTSKTKCESEMYREALINDQGHPIKNHNSRNPKAHRRQTLVQDRRRPTKVEHFLQEGSRR